jgi:GlpG protein
MRQLGTVPDQKIAQRFADYLLTKGISLSVDPAPGGWALWVRNEDHMEEARRQFAEFSAAPDAPVYRDAAGTAERLRAEEQRRAAEAKRNLVNVSPRWRRGGLSGTPVTALLMAASIAVTLWTNLGQKMDLVTRLTIDEQLVPRLTINGKDLDEVPELAQNEQVRQALETLKSGHIKPVPARLWIREPWRLVTPIFLHFGMMHIVFNMIMLWQLGIPIERMMGSIRYLLLVLVIAIPSNFAQYIWGESGPMFGGMSGVVYGLFGYVWMKSRYEPQVGFLITQSSVIWMVGWFFLCVAHVIPNVANIVHGVGLAVGIIVGRLPSLWRSLR